MSADIRFITNTKYKYENTNFKIQIRKHKYENANTKIQIRKSLFRHQYNDINIKNIINVNYNYKWLKYLGCKIINDIMGSLSLT